MLCCTKIVLLHRRSRFLQRAKCKQWNKRITFSWSSWHHVSSTILCAELNFFVCLLQLWLFWRVEVQTRTIATLSAKKLWEIRLFAARQRINYSCEIDYGIYFLLPNKILISFQVPSSDVHVRQAKSLNWKYKMSSLMLARDSPATWSGTIQLTNALWRADQRRKIKWDFIVGNEVNWMGKGTEMSNLGVVKIR